jgi:hypothetical protein
MSANTLDDYLGLATTMYRGKPRFMALCSALVGPLVDAQALLRAMRDGFDLDSAVGVQLDQVGEWVGRSRVLDVPLAGVYFSWGVEGLGWGQGSWKGKYDPATGMVALPDDAYRTLLRAKIAANAWDGTIPGAYEVWATLFAGTGSIIVIQDNQDMTMVVGVAGKRPDAVTKALLVNGLIPLKPGGVRIRYYAVPPAGGKLFAWGVSSEALGGWGAASWPERIIPAT